MFNKMRKEKNLLNKLNEEIENKPLIDEDPDFIAGYRFVEKPMWVDRDFRIGSRAAERPLWIYRAWNADWNTLYVPFYTVGKNENPREAAKVCLGWAQKIAAAVESKSKSDVKWFNADCVEVSFELNRDGLITRDTYIVRFSYLPA